MREATLGICQFEASNDNDRRGFYDYCGAIKLCFSVGIQFVSLMEEESEW